MARSDYSDDPRDHARDRTGALTVTFMHHRGDETYDEETIEIPSKWVVCDLCRGSGKYVNPAIDAHGITAEEFDEDPDFRESYFAGHYDVTCAQCNGRTTVREPDVERCNFDQKRALVTYRREQRELAECDAISRAERRMGA